jgi:uncharacterized protein GlcG (DUF336 family)
MINRVPLDRIEAAGWLVFEEARRDERLMAFCVVDEAGGLVYAARMEGAHARVLRFAINKAYTSAVMQRDTITFRDEDVERQKTLADWGDPNFTHLVGGVVIRSAEGEWLGGLGVGGNATHRDDEVARAALKVVLGG